jgi:glucose-6-phosphate 1-dehydrogenase
MQPLLDSPPAVQSYAPGSWGPDDAESVTAENGGWRTPWQST